MLGFEFADRVRMHRPKYIPHNLVFTEAGLQDFNTISCLETVRPKGYLYSLYILIFPSAVHNQNSFCVYLLFFHLAFFHTTDSQLQRQVILCFSVFIFLIGCQSGELAGQYLHHQRMRELLMVNLSNFPQGNTGILIIILVLFLSHYLIIDTGKIKSIKSFQPWFEIGYLQDRLLKKETVILISTLAVQENIPCTKQSRDPQTSFLFLCTGTMDQLQVMIKIHNDNQAQTIPASN